jgi:hypothetical protein
MALHAWSFAAGVASGMSALILTSMLCVYVVRLGARKQAATQEEWMADAQEVLKVLELKVPGFKVPEAVQERQDEPE